MKHTVEKANGFPWFAAGLCLAAMGIGGCGSDAGGAVQVDGGGPETPDGASVGPCGFESRFLPYQPGYQWTYRVTNLGAPNVTTKVQALTMEADPVLGEVIVQTTSKGTGSTVSALRRVGNAVVRLRQEDRDLQGALRRTSAYDPGQNRLDEAPEHLVLGAQWDDQYTVTISDAVGAPLGITMRTDHWEVLGLDVACSSPLGDFSCLHLRRQRTVGGISDKQYFYAKGIGKVKEVNANQVEELVSCQ